MAVLLTVVMLFGCLLAVDGLSGGGLFLMRKITAVAAAVLLAAGMIATAAAAPAVTDGTVTAWIGENDRLMLQDANGLIRQSSAADKHAAAIMDNGIIRFPTVTDCHTRTPAGEYGV